MPTRTQSTLVAVFRSASDAQAAANELKSNGFDSDEIYISSDTSASNAKTRETSASGYAEERHHEGGITGWFKRIFGAEEDEDRSYYQEAVNTGNVVLSVDTTDENFERAADILNSHSPVDVHRGASASEATTGGRTAVAAEATGRATRNTQSTASGENRAIPVVEEELRVGKRRVLRGGVRIYSRTVEQPVEETVRLQEEHVRVERQPVNRPVNEADLRAGREEVIEVAEYAEEPVVSKQGRVVEEVRVNKDATERTETVRDKVRRTEVNVEDLGQGDGARTGSTRTDLDTDFRNHFTTNYGNQGAQYEDYGPAYRYGYEAADDPRYRGKDFSEVESDLREDYGRRYPNSTWDRIKDSVRYGWDKVTGKAKGTTTSSR
jgi:stress response protein YsnF